MKKKIALVTGANKSIGFEVVRGLAQKGMTVYLGSRDAENGRKAADELKNEGDVRFIQLNLLDEKTMENALKTIAQAHECLDVLVNNAGIAAPESHGDPVFHGAVMDMDDIRSIFETNFFGTIRLTQMAIPLLCKSKAGRIVNVSSSAGSFAYMTDRENPYTKPFAYCTSKLALTGATVLFADELKDDGIKVNAAHPGLVSSALSHYMGTRTGEDGARVIIKLATLDENGPSGGYYDENGPVSW